jgi:hypothetical protein
MSIHLIDDQRTAASSFSLKADVSTSVQKTKTAYGHCKECIEKAAQFIDQEDLEEIRNPFLSTLKQTSVSLIQLDLIFKAFRIIRSRI